MRIVLLMLLLAPVLAFAINPNLHYLERVQAEEGFIYQDLEGV